MAMRYQRTHVRQALAKAREDGRDCAGLSADLRETELQLERWGLLPLPGDTDVSDRVRDWYAAQGLAVRADSPAAPAAVTVAEPVGASEIALTAAEAALEAARAALALARAMHTPAA